MDPEAAPWTRLILWRPRPEFSLPAEWSARTWIPLGELRPLLQAVSPVRDLSDIWRWVAVMLPPSAVEAALASVSPAMTHLPLPDTETNARQIALRVDGQPLQAELILTQTGAEIERIELSAGDGGWLQTPSRATEAAMLAVAFALRESCGCVAAAL